MLSPPQLGDFQVRPAAARTISPEDLPFTISCSGTGCPSAWQLERGADGLHILGKVAPVCAAGNVFPSYYVCLLLQGTLLEGRIVTGFYLTCELVRLLLFVCPFIMESVCSLVLISVCVFVL